MSIVSNKKRKHNARTLWTNKKGAKKKENTYTRMIARGKRMVNVCFDEAEIETIKKAAEEEGRNKHAFIRYFALSAATGILRARGLVVPCRKDS